ncbi:MAG: methyltransferase domain-containing protein [Alphaproteobacteria bacterium]
MSWDPACYARFTGPRLRPALDLLARISVEAPGRICDLGCGNGTVTQQLRQRWPESEIVGVDASAEMLSEAMSLDLTNVSWQRVDLTTWTPSWPVEVMFSNAVLHWLDDHVTLFGRLWRHVMPGGVLAIQMPRNPSASFRTLLTAVIRNGPWQSRLTPLTRPSPVAPPEVYYRLLSPEASHVDVWETEYLHVLEGDNPVLDWTSGTMLRPFLTALDGSPWRDDFLADYGTRLQEAYPSGPDGRTLFPFRRLFMVAVKKGTRA